MGAAAGTWGSEWDDVVDVLVVGSGAAGLSAAVAAASAGAEVLVVEKAEHPGGTTAKSSATMWIPNNPVMRRAGIPDGREDALRFMAKGAHPTQYAPAQQYLGLPPAQFALLEALYDHGGRVFEALVALDAIPFVDEVEPAFPDYYAIFPEDQAPVGRAIKMRLPDGHRPGIDPSGGQYFVDAMLAAGGKLGVALRVGTRVTGLIRDDTDTIVGVEARVGTRTLALGARRGVVFGTGGFLHAPDLAAAYLRGPVLGGAAAPSATGDFVRIGIEAGAAFGNMAHAWWSEVVVEMALRNRSTPHDCVYPFGDSMVIVNRFGARVMNEKMAYNDRGQVHHVWDPGLLEYSNFLLFMIFDDAVMEDPRPTNRPRFPVPGPGQGREHVLSAPTFDDLARAIDRRLAELAPQIGGVRLAPGFAAHLQHTVTRFGDMARAGIDDDFHRGEQPIERAWAADARPGQANPTMRPFESTGHYHCIILGPGALDTKGGPVADHRGRVMHVRGQVIPRLFGAGNCIAGPTGEGYYGPGGTVGPAMTFGYLAGESAAAEVPMAPHFDR